MQHRPHYYRSSRRFDQDVVEAIPASLVARYGEQWVLAGDAEGHSDDTLSNKRLTLRLLTWFLDHKQIGCFDTQAIREFLVYARHAHNDPEGRWGGKGVHCRRALSPGSLATYHRHISSFCSWMVEEDILTFSPAARVKPPENNPDEVDPYSPAEIEALLLAAKRHSWLPSRDRAIILLLLDTGIRESELLGLGKNHIEFHPNKVKVLGKGHKIRSIPFQSETRRAVWTYGEHASERWGEDALLEQFFRPVKGTDVWTRSGLLRMIQRVAGFAGVADANVHRFRHTAAITFLRAGGNVYELAAMLGHQDLKMSRRYAKIADCDIEVSHRKHSPVEYMLGKGRRR